MAGAPWQPPVRTGQIQPMRFDRPSLMRAAAAVTSAAPAGPEQLPGGVSRGQAEQMANAAQALLDVVRATPAHVLESWLESTTDQDHRRVLAALQGVRAALR